MTVIVYTTPTCGYCHQAKNYLTQKGVPFVEKDVSRDQAAAQEMVRKSNQMGVPVLDVDGQIIVGFDMRRLEQLLANRQRRGPALGLKVADAARIAAKQGSGPTSGAYVGDVEVGSPGQRAGMQVGDVIVAVGGRTVTNADDLANATQDLQPNSRVRIDLVRGGQLRAVQVAL